MTQKPSELTRAQALLRREIIGNCRYEIFLDLDCSPTRYACQTRIFFTAKPGNSSFIDVITSRLDQASLNGKVLNLADLYDGQRLLLPDLALYNELEVDGFFDFTNTGDGLHRFVDPVDGRSYLYSHFEPNHADIALPVFNQPDIKASFVFSVRAPEDWTVITNSPLKKQRGDTRDFFPTAPISAYLAAVVAGPYHGEFSQCQSSGGQTIKLGIWCRQSLAKYLDADYLFNVTKKGMAFYEEKFDYPYPFQKYDQIFCPEYNSGAMENVGCVTINEKYVFCARVDNYLKERRVVTLLHELAHMWFGDLVTMKWWGDLWLKESFAEYLSTLATAEVTEWKGAWATFAIGEKSWAYKQDQYPTTHPVSMEVECIEAVMANFDGITYAKGASILKQLVSWLGPEDFFRGLAAYFQKYAYANADFYDLLDCLSKAGNRPLEDWARLWLKTTGVEVILGDIQAENGLIKRLVLKQISPILRPQNVRVGFYELEDGRLRLRQSLTARLEAARLEIESARGLAQPDLVLVNDRDLTYAKIGLDKRSSQTVRQRLGQIEDPLARAVIWTGLWEEVRDGTRPYADFIDLALDHLQAEENTALKMILDWLGEALRLYTPAPKRAEAIDLAVGKLWGIFEEAKDFSDLKLQVLNAITDLAARAQDLARLREILKGKTPGISLDDPLIWNILTALAAGDQIGEQEISAQLTRNPAAAGQEAALRARAARVEGKKRAWQDIFNNPDMSVTKIIKLCQGFMRVNEAGDLKPFVNRYFEDIWKLCQARGDTVAKFVVPSLYPLPLASGELVLKTEAWLSAGRQASELTRRHMQENLYRSQLIVGLQARQDPDSVS